ncbi:Multisubstrate pseudouridine synthase 7 [Spathaspora sp. JA1]|nr:Multisubstrate pseudouridine synthase 7 [Spathaspora sp. JA1]
MSVESTLKRAAPNACEESSKKIKIAPGLAEHDVGITQFLNPNIVGFTGSIKTLYSDFQVNEIDLQGNVVHLEDDGIDVGKSKKERRLEQRAKEREELEGKSEQEISEILADRQAKADAEAKAQAEAPKYELSDEDKSELLTLITEEELSQVESLFSTGNNVETKSSFEDKQQRGKLHQLFRKAFQGKLETVTTPENTFRIKIATKQTRGNNRNNNPMDSMHHVDENGVLNYGLGKFKPYLHFTLFKQNRDTMDSASGISRLLRIPPNAITFAGTKDRRGSTCQRFSLHKGKVVRVNSLNKGLTNIVLGGFTYEDTPLKLGDLKGNEFLITIRNVASDSSEEDINKVVERCFSSLRDHGYINYFGMQRFGTFSISSHSLGIHCLKEDYKSCVELLLSEQEQIAPASMEARKIWAETRDPSAALKKLPHFFNAETSILKVLEKEKRNEAGEYNKNSYFKAIMAIPRNLRMLYGHSYQSYVWNFVASKRIELFGLELQEGDLVIDSNDVKPVDQDDDFEEDVATSNETKVRALTKEDINSGKCSIFDVVLPTPGFKITYPVNETLKQVYVDIMAQDGLDPFKMARRIKEFSLPGSYRHILARAENLTYELVQYNSNEVPIVRTDHEILQLKKQGEVEPKRIVESEGDKLAVVLKMQLGVSSYATMALREFMRIDTSRMSDSMYKQ